HRCERPHRILRLQATDETLGRARACRFTGDTRMNTKWHCERHEGGWLIVADWGGKQFAQHLKADQMRTAHEPGFVFWSAVGSITRAISAYRAMHENQRKLFGLRKHLDKLLSGGWRISCRDPLCIA